MADKEADLIRVPADFLLHPFSQQTLPRTDRKHIPRRGAFVHNTLAAYALPYEKGLKGERCLPKLLHEEQDLIQGEEPRICLPALFIYVRGREAIKRVLSFFLPLIHEPGEFFFQKLPVTAPVEDFHPHPVRLCDARRAGQFFLMPKGYRGTELTISVFPDPFQYTGQKPQSPAIMLFHTVGARCQDLFIQGRRNTAGCHRDSCFPTFFSGHGREGHVCILLRASAEDAPATAIFHDLVVQDRIVRCGIHKAHCFRQFKSESFFPADCPAFFDLFAYVRRGHGHTGSIFQKVAAFPCRHSPAAYDRHRPSF